MPARSLLRVFLGGLLGVCAMLVCGTARAQDIPGYGGLEEYDPREVALLPRYCDSTLLFKEKVPGGADPEKVAKWQAYLGETFRHLHHYCWGMMKTNRAVLLARDPQVKHGYLTDSIREFDYVLQRSTPDFILLPEILTKKGENLILLNRAPLGILELEKAATIKPDYWPPYAQISDYYMRVGEKQKARETLEKGLSFSPDAQALRRRLNELGGMREAQSTSNKAKTTP